MKGVWFRVAIWMVIVLTLGIHLQAQPLPVRLFTQNDGLPTTLISTFHQTEDGAVWIGHDEGLTWFDGAVFHNLKPPVNNVWGGVNVLRPDASGNRLWVASNRGGLFRADRRNLEHIPFGNALAERGINDIFVLGADSLLLATDGGFFVYHPSGSVEYPLAQGDTASYNVFRHEGRFWTTSLNFLYEVDLKRRRLVLSDTLLTPQDARFQVVRDTNNIILYRGTGEWMRLENGRLTALPSEISSPSGYIIQAADTIRIVRSGGMWKSIHILRDRIAARPFTELQHPYYDFPNYGSGFLDRDSNLWIALVGQGLVYKPAQKARILPFNGISGKLHADSTGRLWFGRNQVLHRLDPDSIRISTFYPLQAPPKRQIFSVFSDTRGRLMVVWDDWTIHRYNYPSIGDSLLKPTAILSKESGFPPLFGITTLLDKKGRLWIPWASEGIAIIDLHAEPPKLLSLLGPDQKFPMPRVRALEQLPDGTILAGGQTRGLIRITEPKTGSFSWTHEIPDSLLFDEHGVRALLKAPGDTLWAGTRYGGLLLYDGARWQRIGEESGLSTRQVWTLDRSESGSLLIGAQNGLYLLNHTPKGWLAAKDRELAGPIFGVQWVTGSSYAAGSTVTVALMDARKIRTTDPPAVLLTRVRFGGHEVNPEGMIHLEPGQNSAEISFTAIHHKSEIPLLFQHRVNSGEWSVPSTGRTLTLPLIRPGEHRIQIRTIFPLSGSSSRITELLFVLPPPWYLDLRIVVPLILLLIGLGTFALYAYYEKKLAIERLRARLARDLHDDIGSGLTRLALISEVLMRADLPEVQLSPSIGSPKDAAGRIASMARELMDEMSDVVFSLSARSESTSALLNRLLVYLRPLCESAGVQFTADVQPGTAAVSLSPDQQRALLLVMKEAASNSLRHGRPASVSFEASARDGGLQVCLMDDGQGFDPSAARRVNGLHNMKERAERAGCVFNIYSKPGSGTRVSLFIAG